MDAILPRVLASTRHSAAVSEIAEAILERPGETDPALRRAVASYGRGQWLREPAETEIPAELKPYLDKVVKSAYKVVEEDIERLRGAGWSEDQIFELTVACALGCGLSGLDVGLTTLRGA